MTNAEQQIAEDEPEVSLNDIIRFFITYWKLLFVGAISGLIIALCGALLFGSHEAEATLTNRHNIDYLKWKNIKRNLPLLAAKASDSAKDNFVRTLAKEIWWEKNVVATFSIGKDDAKILLGIPKEMQDQEATKIKNFIVRATGANKEEAISNLAVATSFLRNGAAYLALNDTLASYQGELKNAETEINKNISATEIELTYLNGRMANLELLGGKLSGSTSPILINQPVDVKYLPLATQLIAVKHDIQAMKEKLARFRDRKDQLTIMSNFLSQAIPVLGKDFDGLRALTDVMQIETSLRKNLQPSSWSNINALDGIRHDLVLIHTSFAEGLEQPMFINTRKPDPLKPAAIGLLSGFFFALLGSICSVILLRYRRQKSQ